MRHVEFETSFTPHINQLKILNSKARFKVVKAGRQFGKSKIGINWLIRKAIENPGERVYYVAPTYKMAKDIAWQELFSQLPEELIRRKDERELWVELINGSRIYLKGSEVPDNLRGPHIAALLMDEAAFQRPDIFDRILEPMIVARRAPVMFISSPKPGWFSQIFKHAEACKDGTWEAFHFTIFHNPTISREEIERVKARKSDHIWRSEFMAEDVEYFGAVYGEFGERNIYSPTDLRLSDGFPCVVGIDWGSDDPTGVAWLHFSPEGRVYVAREHQRSGWDTGRHSEVIRNGSRSRNVRQGDYVLSFDAFRRTAKDHNSIAEDFRGHLGFMPQASAKDFASGVDIVKRYLRGDGESPWLLVSSDCPESIKAFQEWEWNDHEPDIIAAVRYGLMHGLKRGYSRLAEMNKVRYHLEDTFGSARENVTVLPKPKSRGAQWSFDNNFGVPGLA